MKINSHGKKPSKSRDKQKDKAVLVPTILPACQEAAPKTNRRRGVRSAGSDLAKLIEMANLAGDRELPYEHFGNSAFETEHGLVSAMLELEEPLRSHLVQVMREESEPTFAGVSWANVLKKGLNPERVRLACQAQAVSARYQLIRSAYNALKRIVGGEPYFPANTFLERRVDPEGKHKVRYAINEIIEPLIRVDDLRDIRRCAVCEKFFFARRSTSVVCDPEGPCASTYSKRKERKNKKLRKELELKRKRAKTARKQ